MNSSNDRAEELWEEFRSACERFLANRSVENWLAKVAAQREWLIEFSRKSA